MQGTEAEEFIFFFPLADLMRLEQVWSRGRGRGRERRKREGNEEGGKKEGLAAADGIEFPPDKH